MSAQLVAFAGSNRTGSYNRGALALVVEGARAAGASVDLIDLRDYALPLYDAEFHAAHGVPDAARALRAKMIGARGLLVASPEYNASITPLLKNTIDWLSQAVAFGAGAGGGNAPFENKVVGLVGASAGGFGTIRALPHVAYIFSNLGAIVLPVVAVPQAHSLINVDGSVGNEGVAAALRTLGGRVAQVSVCVEANSI